FICPPNSSRQVRYHTWRGAKSREACESMGVGAGSGCQKMPHEPVPRGEVRMSEKSAFWEIGALEAQRERSAGAYLEFLRVPALSAGVYALPAGTKDRQSPHREDEIYYVVRGRARMRAGAEDRAVAAGSVIFVAAEVPHEFYAIEEDLSVLV